MGSKLCAMEDVGFLFIQVTREKENDSVVGRIT